MHFLVELPCPNCGILLSTTYRPFINADIDADALEELYEGTLGLVTCPDCGKLTCFDGPIFFRDPAHRAVIAMAPKSTPKKVAEARQMLETEQSSLSGADEGASWQLRLVTSRDELREKALIFRDGYDDRVMELLKLCLYRHWQSEHPDLPKAVVRYDATNEDCAVTMIDEDGRQIVAWEFDKDTYRKFLDLAEGRMPDIFTVDTVWAADWLLMREAGIEYPCTFDRPSFLS